MVNFSPDRNFNQANRAEILSRLHNEFQQRLGTKYEIAREESRENQAAILFSAFQLGLKFLFNYMRFFSALGAIQSGLKILIRFDQTRLGFSARAESLSM